MTGSNVGQDLQITLRSQRGEHVPDILQGSDVRVLVADEDEDFGSAIAEGLVARGWHAVAIRHVQEVLALLTDGRVQILVADLRMREMNGLQLLAFIKKQAPGVPVITMATFGATDAAFECIRRGAFQCLMKPFKLADLDHLLRRATEERVRCR